MKVDAHDKSRKSPIFKNPMCWLSTTYDTPKLGFRTFVVGIKVWIKNLTIMLSGQQPTYRNRGSLNDWEDIRYETDPSPPRRLLRMPQGHLAKRAPYQRGWISRQTWGRTLWLSWREVLQPFLQRQLSTASYLVKRAEAIKQRDHLAATNPSYNKSIKNMSMNEYMSWLLRKGPDAFDWRHAFPIRIGPMMYKLCMHVM